MWAIGLVLVIAGFGACLLAGIGVALAAFRKSFVWGLAYLFIPLVAIVFIAQNWEDTKDKVYFWLKGFGVGMIGLFVMQLASPSITRPEAQPAAQSAIRETDHPRVQATPTAAPPMPRPPSPPLSSPARAPMPWEIPVPIPSGMAALRIYFRNPFPNGLLIVKVDERESFRREFDTGKSDTVATLDDFVLVDAGTRSIKIWAFSIDRTVSEYRVFSVSFGSGESRALELELQAAGLAIAMR